MRDLETFYGPNAGYVQELYERYLQNPASVDPQTRAVFDSWSQDHEAPPVEETGRTDGHVHFQVSDVVAASALTHAIRERGQLGARLDPLGTEPLGDPALLPETHGITNEDLALLPPTIVGGHAAEGAHNALEAINTLRGMYSGTISYEFDQVKSSVERYWLRDAVGLHLYQQAQSPAASRKLLQRLTQVEVFERYLHQAYPGQKRFSLEGTDTLVPMLDELIEGAIESETREIIIGMAHRGRLNVLAHVLDKPYKDILSEFSISRHEEGVPLTDTFGFGWTGDVKYHLGFEHILGEDASVGLKVILAPNPSHLEFVNPVIEGMARASQEMRKVPGEPMLDVDVALPVLIHGDAAFPGEGVVAETLNLWRLPGYWVGGTIHIIINNQLGFTTGPEEARSTHFASDLAKGFVIPIIHVNADDPDACLTAIRLAYAFRDQFHKDILIDLVGYRRWGHNEGDEPAFTQPHMYETIRSHPTVRELYARRLEEAGIITKEEADKMAKDAFAVLEEARREADSGLHLADARASFSIYNSPLSEAAALGVEYGYSVHAPDSLVLWEAQFGDFANAAQVIIDQFIASARAKWKQKSALVLLLPHGYEGQGPEHSSARLERYLQLSAQTNWRVANCSTAAQYFHLLRQQAFYLSRDRRPLIVMSPTRLLRHPLPAATLTELAEGTFQPVIDDQMALTHAGDIRRLLLSTGKMAIELLAHEKRAQAEDLAIVRVEMLYPFPANELKKVLANYPHIDEITWVQEEPGNMGAWNYLSPKLSALVGSKMKVNVIARPDRASPASGFIDLFMAEQEHILEEALGTSIKEHGGKRARLHTCPIPG